MVKVAQWVARLSDVFQRLSALLVMALVLLTTQQVIARYLFNASSTALQELEWHLFGVIFLLTAAATLKSDEHVRVDIFYARFSERTRLWVNLIGFLILFFPPVAAITYYGVESTLQALDYPSSRPQDFWSKRWFGEGSAWYNLAAPVEKWLRQFLLIGESSPDPGGLDARWLIKACIPLGMGLLWLQGLTMFLQQLVRLIKSYWEER